MNIMENFEQDRIKESKFYAHVNLFKLLFSAKLTKKDYNAFCLIGGLDSLNQLENDINNNRICLYNINEDNEITEKCIGDFYVEMLKLKEELSSRSFSKSVILNKTLKEVDMISDYLQKIYSNAVASDLISAMSEPIKYLLEAKLPNALVSIIEKYDYNNIEENQFTKKL